MKINLDAVSARGVFCKSILNDIQSLVPDKYVQDVKRALQYVSEDYTDLLEYILKLNVAIKNLRDSNIKLLRRIEDLENESENAKS